MKMLKVFVLLTFVTLTLSPNTFAQGTTPENMVRLVYFLPSDRPVRPDRVAAFQQLIKDAQTFYADQMEAHGYGRKTFRVETDKDGEPVVHRINGKFNDDHYQKSVEPGVWEEVVEHFEDFQHVYFIAIDVSSEILGESTCGLGAMSYFSFSGGFGFVPLTSGGLALRHREITPGQETLGGYAIIPASGHCFFDDVSGDSHPLRVTTHELAHAFGLEHDFSAPDSAVGGRGFRFSHCDAEWLSVSRYFNSNPVSENTPGNIQLISAPTYSAEGIALHFEVTDADGLHQAQLLVPEYGSWGPWKLIGCQTLDGQTQRVEFLSSELTSAPERVMLQFMDDLGNITWATFLVDIASLLPRPKIVSIPDRNLAAAVRKALGLGANARITDQAMQRLTRLDARRSQIKNLTGLEHATRLVELALFHNQIQDVSPLAGLIQLQRLYLQDNQIRDITPLAKLTQLRQLHLWHNQIRDIGILKGLTQLESLWLESNQIRDISPLTGLTQLRDLKLNGNPIQDMSPLRTLLNRNPNLDVDIEIPPLSPVVHLESAQRPPMHWVGATTGTLHRLVGDEVETLVPTVKNATSLAVDIAGGKLYWAEKKSDRTGRIRRANLDGTGVQLVKDLTSVPYGIVLDAADGKIYLTNAWGKVQRLNVNGSNFQPNLITGLDSPRGLALDVSGGKVYWIEMSGRIRRADLDGSDMQDVATGLGGPMNLVVFDGTVYWTEKTGENQGEIRFVNLNGTPKVVTRNTFPQSFPIGIALDTVERKLYWTTSNGKIGRSNLDGGDSQPDVVTNLGALGALVVSVDPTLVVETKEVPTTDAVLSISPSPITSPAIGERLTLNLNISAGEAVAGYQVTLRFDPIALRYVESSNGDYLPTGAFFLPPIVKGNRVELASTALAGISKGDGTLATVTFEVLAVKASTLTLSETLLSDSEGNTFQPRVEGGEITEPPKLQTDVNGDGVVNIQDLVLVASNFGETGQNPADVNADGVVNIADLVLVAGNLNTGLGAPSLYPDSLEMFTTADVQEWLSQAQGLNSSHVDYQRGVLVLEQFLLALTPKDTQLLPNYPNPFNPETWIPYQLSESAEVTLHIYAVSGRLIRTLSLGPQPAGRYQSKSRAAYWDGRNALGEPVASGVYFYTLTAGDFSATRKMLIMK